eukprot:scaffold182866_cov33-Tisochrysis_lutea.AAC.2
MLRAQPLPSLKYLKLFGNKLSSEGISSLAAAIPSLSGLERFDLDNNTSDDVDIHDATRMGVQRSGNHIGDSGAEALTAALMATPVPSLKALNMAGNGIGDRGAAALCALLRSSSISEMNLIRNTFSAATALELAKTAVQSGRAVIFCSGLSGLNADATVASLVSSDLSDPDGVLLAGTLHMRGAMPNITELRLHDNLLGDSTASALADVIASGVLPSLLTLTLNCNCIGDEGFAAFANLMRPGSALSRLESLGLRQNLLSDHSMAALANCLGDGAMPALQQLLLGNNALTADGIIQLAATLKEGKSLTALRVLELQKNNIGDAGAEALAQAIAGGALPQLRELYLFHNALTMAGEIAVKSTGAPQLTRVVASLPKMFDDDE